MNRSSLQVMATCFVLLFSHSLICQLLPSLPCAKSLIFAPGKLQLALTTNSFDLFEVRMKLALFPLLKIALAPLTSTTKQNATSPVERFNLATAVASESTNSQLLLLRSGSFGNNGWLTCYAYQFLTTVARLVPDIAYPLATTDRRRFIHQNQ